MRFSCDSCGKKYATADDPAPGRVYKIKCKACGHLIVVKASAGGAPAVPHHEPAAAPSPTPSGGIPLEIGAPERDAPPVPWPEERRARGGEPTAHVEMPVADEPPPPPLPATPGDGAGYVDLFGTEGSALPGATPAIDPFSSPGPLDDFGAGASPLPDPFAPVREVKAHETVTPDPPPMPKVPVIPKPAQQRSVVPMALAGGGVVLLLAIVGFVVMSRGGKAADAPAAAAPQPAKPVVAAAAKPPPPAPAVAEPVAPPVAQPEPEAKPPAADPAAEAREREARARADRERLAREERARQAAEEKARAAAESRDRARADRAERDRAAREEKARLAAEAKERARAAAEERARAAAEAKERARLAAEEKARAARERAARDAAAREQRERDDRVAMANEAEQSESLTQAQIEGVLRASKPSFDSCMRAAAGGDVKLDGRRIMLRLNIQPSGAVTYPTIDDVVVNGADLGSCLKGAARSMLFPKFSGDTMHVEVPIALR